MVTPTVGAIVLVPFPFSDLSHSMLRPAAVLADAGKADWVLCQITSRSYTDPHAIKIEDMDFVSGSLKLLSYARPGKLFTASSDLMMSQVGLLKKEKVEQIVGAVVNLLQAGL